LLVGRHAAARRDTHEPISVPQPFECERLGYRVYRDWNPDYKHEYKKRLLPRDRSLMEDG